MVVDDTNKEQPRYRLPKDIDLSKAKKHNRCHGTGITGYRKVNVPGQGMVDAPVICKCVSRRGGVAKDAFDKILDTIQSELDSGMFARNLVADIGQLSEDDKVKAIENVRVQSLRTDLDPQVKTQIEEALKLLTA